MLFYTERIVSLICLIINVLGCTHCCWSLKIPACAGVKERHCGVTEHRVSVCFSAFRRNTGENWSFR